MEQIYSRGYGKKYKAQSKPVHLIALVFEARGGNVAGMRVENMCKDVI